MREQYRLPRSERISTPLGIFRRHGAVCKASQTSPAFMRLSMARPGNIRGKRSGTTARSPQPSPVHK